MSDPFIPTFMRPHGIVPAKIGSISSTGRAPRFEGVDTYGIRYHDTVRKWVSIFRFLCKTVENYEIILANVGIMMYMSCDDAAKDLLNSTEKKRTINLEGFEKDRDLGQLVEQVLDIITEDSEYDKRIREVELIENLTCCHREDE